MTEVVKKCRSVQCRLEENPDMKRMEIMVNHRLKQSSRRQISRFRVTVEIVATLQNTVRHTSAMSFLLNSTVVRVDLFRLSTFLYVNTCIFCWAFPWLNSKTPTPSAKQDSKQAVFWLWYYLIPSEQHQPTGAEPVQRQQMAPLVLWLKIVMTPQCLEVY